MDVTLYVRVAVALAVVLGLIALAALVARRLGLTAPVGSANGARRIRVSETLYLDQKRRIVLLSCDGEDHLVLLGAQGEIVLPRSGAAPSTAVDAAKPKDAAAPAVAAQNPSIYDDIYAAPSRADRAHKSTLKPPPPALKVPLRDERGRREPTLGPLPGPKGRPAP